LPLAARVCRDQLAALVGRGHEIEQFIGPLAPLGLALPADLEAEGNIVRH